MPLTHKGAVIKAALQKEYGEKAGERILYAGKNKGTFTGIDSHIERIAAECDRLDARMDALCRDDGGDEPGNGKEPYGDVKYADPGYQEDKKERYPIDTPEHIRSAWNYIHKGRDSGKYSPEHLSAIKRRIVSAWKAKIGKDGPPEAKG